MSFESIHPLTQQPTDGDDLRQRVPDVCTAHQLALLLAVTDGQIRRLYREGKLDALILKPQVGRTVRFSGVQVRAWVRGADLTATRRFFGGARKRS